MISLEKPHNLALASISALCFAVDVGWITAQCRQSASVVVVDMSFKFWIGPSVGVDPSFHSITP